MPQLNSDEAANDEPKTYNDEAIDGDDGWQDSKDLNDIKGDLVGEDDGDPIPQLYDNKITSHRNGEGNTSSKGDLERDHQKDMGGPVQNYPYTQQDFSSIVSGLSHPLFPNGFLPPSEEQQTLCNAPSVYSFMMEVSALLSRKKRQIFGYQNNNFLNSACACSYAAGLYEVLRQRKLERAAEQVQWLQQLRSDISVFMEQLQSQVHYPPYMGPYMGSLFHGGSSPIDLDGKQGATRGAQSDIPSMYSLPGQLGQIPNPLAPWSPSPLYPLCTASAMAGMLRYPYPFHNFSSTSGAMGSVPPFPLVPPHPHASGIHPNMLHPAGLPLPGHMMNGQANGGKSIIEKKIINSESVPPKRSKSEKPNRPYVKKPLNAFMIYMKEQRAQVVAECTLKESAAINQILGRKWHSLNRDEQQKYYEMARKERQLHMQMFPGWSARDNYGKRKKRKKEKTQDCTAACHYSDISSVFHQTDFQSPSFGFAQRRKKKCIRYQQDGDDSDDSDVSPGGYQESPDGMYLQSTPNSSENFDPAEHPFVSQPSSSAGAASSGTSQPRPTPPSEQRLSPDHAMLVDQIKQEKSPPMPNDPNTPCSKSKPLNGMFHPPTTSLASSANEVSNNGNVSSNKKPRTGNTLNNQNHQPSSKNRSFSENSRVPPENRSGFPASIKSGPDARNQRSSSSHPESPLNNSSKKQNLFNPPMLSPTSMGLNSPHSNPHPFLPSQFSYLAASLPAPPLSSLMGFPGFSGLTSPIGMGLSGPGSSVSPGGHPGSSASRHTTSALEGKS